MRARACLAARRPDACCAPQDEKFAYVQFTVRYWTTHTFAAYDAKGRLVAGDPNHLLPVRSAASFPAFTCSAHAGRLFARCRLCRAL